MILGGEGPASAAWLETNTAVMTYAASFNAGVIQLEYVNLAELHVMYPLYSTCLLRHHRLHHTIDAGMIMIQLEYE